MGKAKGVRIGEYEIQVKTITAQEWQEANKTAKQFEQNLSKESCPTKTKFNKMQQPKYKNK